MRITAVWLFGALFFVVLFVRPSPADGQELARPLIEAELEKMKGMSDAQSFSYLRTSSTLRDLEVMGLVLKAYRMKYGRYPAATSMAQLQPMLSPELVSEVRTNDRWGTELRYVASNDGRSYRLISAGADTLFDEASWTSKGKLASADEDAVLENGELVREWTVETQPGLGVRAKLKPKARTLLAQADARLAADDPAGALNAYIEAVKADRAAADLEAIRRYAPPVFQAAPPPPPPPPARGSDPKPPAVPQAQKRADATPSHIASLRQFLEIHPRHAEAERDLVVLLPAAEADVLADHLVKRQPRDPEIYKLRSQLRFRAARYADGLADLEHATTLAPDNAELFYVLGVTSYEMVAKRPETKEQEKRDLIRRGLAALDRAESLRANYFESLVYRNLLLREQSKLETNPAVRQKLNEEADAVRQRAIEITRARRAKPAPEDANVTPATPGGAGPFRTGGDVKPPVVRHRVEPVFPEAARKARVAGIVILEVVIDKQGRVSDARVLKPLPFGLDAAALDAVRQWTFQPGTLDGQPVDVIFNITVNMKPE